MSSNTIEIVIRSRMDERGGGGLSALQSSLGRIAEFAIGGVIAQGLSRLASGIGQLGQNAIGAASEMQNLGIALEGLVAREMSGGLNRMIMVPEEVRQAYEDAKEKIVDLDKDFADQQADIQKDLGKALADITKNTNKRLAELQYDHLGKVAEINGKIEDLNADLSDALVEAAEEATQRMAEAEEKHLSKVADLRQNLAELSTDYEYDRAERTEDLTRALTRAEEDYTHKREGMVKDLAAAETEEEKARVQERIDELDYEYNTRKKRREEDAAEAEQDAKDAFEKRKAAIEQQLAEEETAYQKQTEKLKAENEKREADVREQFDKRLKALQDQLGGENREYAHQVEELRAQDAERVANVKERYSEELAAATERYNAEVEKAKAAIEAIRKEAGPGLEMQAGMDAGPIMSLQDALKQAGPKAAELMEWLRKLSLESPFEYSKIAEVFRFTMAMGASTDMAKSLTASLVDLAAGSGMTGEMLDRVNYNLSQALIKGDLSAANLRQLTNAGVDLASILQNELGMSLDEIREKFKSGEISSEDLANAFSSYTEKNFSGSAERMSKSLSGLESSFKDLFFFAGADLLTPALETVSIALGGVFDKLSGMLESGKFKEMGDQLGAAMDVGIQLADSILRTGANSEETKGKLEAIFGEDSPIVEALGGFMENIDKLGGAFKSVAEDPVFKDWIEGITTFIKDEFIPGVLDLAGYLTGEVADAVTGLAGWLKETLAPAIAEVWVWFKFNLYPILEDIWKKIDEDLRPVLDKIFENLQAASESNIPNAKAQFELLGDALTAIFTVVDKLIGPLSDLLGWMSDVQVKLQPFLDMLNPITLLFKQFENLATIFDILSGVSERAGGPLNALKNAFDWVSGAIQGAIDTLDTLFANLGKLKIPEILTQHSPSPFEQSFLDLGAAMKGVTESALPDFRSSFDVSMPSMAPALAPAYAGGGGGGGGTTVVIQAGTLLGFQDAYELQQQLEPLMDEYWRKKKGGG